MEQGYTDIVLICTLVEFLLKNHFDIDDLDNWDEVRSELYDLEHMDAVLPAIKKYKDGNTVEGIRLVEHLDRFCKSFHVGM
ncbi:hypothetical protein HK097_008336 [Rhizophlyctis rosea]|uniref:Uncharacterized protein n=1 Tax=Rhizophlyctis rosea TaxID=64517 RepID=A0AAD5X5C2_9FUNG|nr:hypothetical protein HK097_008336 [Rhizophlyctis rosea]